MVKSINSSVDNVCQRFKEITMKINLSTSSSSAMFITYLIWWYSNLCFGTSVPSKEASNRFHSLVFPEIHVQNDVITYLKLN
jgi:hypothetical protein